MPNDRDRRVPPRSGTTGAAAALGMGVVCLAAALARDGAADARNAVETPFVRAPSAAARVTLGPGGADLRVAGDLMDGVATRVAALLAAHPDVRRIHLDQRRRPRRGGAGRSGADRRTRARHLRPRRVRLRLHAGLRPRPCALSRRGRPARLPRALRDRAVRPGCRGRCARRTRGLPRGRPRRGFHRRSARRSPDALWMPKAERLIEAGAVTEIVETDRFPDSTLDDDDGPDAARGQVLRNLPVLAEADPSAVDRLAAWYRDGYRAGRTEADALDGLRRRASAALKHLLHGADDATVRAFGHAALAAMRKAEAGACEAIAEGDAVAIEQTLRKRAAPSAQPACADRPGAGGRRRPMTTPFGGGPDLAGRCRAARGSRPCDRPSTVRSARPRRDCARCSSTRRRARSPRSGRLRGPPRGTGPPCCAGARLRPRPSEADAAGKAAFSPRSALRRAPSLTTTAHLENAPAPTGGRSRTKPIPVLTIVARSHHGRRDTWPTQTPACPPSARRPRHSRRIDGVLLIRIEAVAKRYPAGAHGRPVAALSGIDLTVLPGTVLGIIGRSGAGKSTLIRLLNGLENAEFGPRRRRWRGGVEPRRAGPARRAQADRHGVPALQPARLAHRRRQRGAAAGDRRPAARRHSRAGRGPLGSRRPRRQARPLPGRAFGGAEAWGRHRAGARHRTEGAALRRGDLGAGSGDDPFDPRPARADQPRPRPDHRAHHPRDVGDPAPRRATRRARAGAASSRGPGSSTCSPGRRPRSPAPCSPARWACACRPTLAERLRPEAGPGTATVLRITFSGPHATDPIIARLARETGIEANILSGTVDEIGGEPFGSLIVALPPGPDMAARAGAFLQARNLAVDPVGRLAPAIESRHVAGAPAPPRPGDRRHAVHGGAGGRARHRVRPAARRVPGHQPAGRAARRALGQRRPRLRR